MDATPFGACVPLCVPSCAVVALAGLLVLELWASTVDFEVLGSAALVALADKLVPCSMA